MRIVVYENFIKRLDKLYNLSLWNSRAAEKHTEKRDFQSIRLNQKLIKGLKRVAQLYAPKHSKLISIVCLPYLVIRSSIENGRCVAKQTYHEMSQNFLRF